MIFQFFYSPFFQLNCYFWCERVNRDIAAHRRIFDPPPPSPARVYLHRAATQKRTVRNDKIFMILQFIHSPFFQLNCYFWFERVNRDIAAHRRIFDPPPPSPACVYLHRAATQKRTVRNDKIFMILQFIHSPFFS
jgi:hypothetical protein